MRIRLLTIRSLHLCGFTLGVTGCIRPRGVRILLVRDYKLRLHVRADARRRRLVHLVANVLLDAEFALEDLADAAIRVVDGCVGRPERNLKCLTFLPYALQKKKCKRTLSPFCRKLTAAPQMYLP